MKRLLVIIIPLWCLLFLGCRKNAQGSGGKASISGYVELTGTVDGNYIVNARVYRQTVVYIKYGATSFPGVDPSQYDSQQNVDAQGNFNFATMFMGDYYLYATGYYILPNGFIAHLTGGIQVSITNRKQSVNNNIPVNP
ncbi:MAG: hypothetical protein ACYDCN_08130 [Bacteroidia bacterium]